MLEQARYGIRIVLGIQDTAGAPVQVTAINQLTEIGISTRPVRDVLERIGMVEDDRTPTVDMWFERSIDTLPEPMRDELRIWWDVIRHGSTRAPRRHPRSPKTARSQLSFVLPTLRGWAQTHESLREISRADVLAVLPVSGSARSTTLQGLRSVFAVLKGRKLTFCNPTAHIRGPRLSKAAPPAIDLPFLRTALDSEDLATAAVAALVAFHALTSGQICALLLTDVRDGRLHLGDRVIPLARPARERLRAYLDYRNDHWPGTANPHLFIHYRTATHTGAATACWVRTRLGMNPQHIRQDRILDEAHATRGDVRLICDLFGLTAAGAYRYIETVDHPGVAEYAKFVADDRGTARADYRK